LGDLHHLYQAEGQCLGCTQLLRTEEERKASAAKRFSLLCP